jgi:hypothetical protein
LFDVSQIAAPLDHFAGRATPTPKNRWPLAANPASQIL